MYPTIEELIKQIKYAIENGEDNYILNDLGYPYTYGYRLNVTEPQKGPLIIARSQAELEAALNGNIDYSKMPKYNIDWDVREDSGGNYCILKKKDGSRVTMMGSFDFNTPEEGAQKWLEQLKERTPSNLWTSEEEHDRLHKKINEDFQAFFDKHCSDQAEKPCPMRATCEVRWPGGFGLKGCRIGEFSQDRGIGFSKTPATEENLRAADAIAAEIKEMR